MTTRPLYLENRLKNTVPPGTVREAGRIVLTLSEADAKLWNNLDRQNEAVVSDQKTGAKWVVWRADCGLSCFCAADGKVVE